MIPSIGRIVHYRLSQYDVDHVQEERRLSAHLAEVPNGHPFRHFRKTGNTPKAGDVYPMMITRVWEENPTEGSCVQGQVFLDGNDTIWKTSVYQAGKDTYGGVPLESAEPDADATVNGMWADPMDAGAWDDALAFYRQRLEEQRRDVA